MSNEMILAFVIVARMKHTYVSEEDIKAVCGANGINFDTVKQFIEEATASTQKENAETEMLQTLVAISIAKSKDVDDEDLKNVTIAYANFVAMANKLRERFLEQSGEIITNLEDAFNKLKIARGEV